MRATINFDIEIDKVEETMGVLVTQEATSLNHAITILENIENINFLEELTEAIDLLQATTAQLQQYKDMLVSFERARFETMLPQPVDQAQAQNLKQVNEIKESMQKLDHFLGKINEGGDDDPEEG
jgi:hypothetical protein